MKDPQDLNFLVNHPVGDQISRIRHDELARPRQATRTAELRIGLQGGQSHVNSGDDENCGVSVIPSNELSFLFQVLKCPTRPAYAQRIQREKTRSTSLGEANSPRSASSKARPISWVCHSSNSR